MEYKDVRWNQNVRNASSPGLDALQRRRQPTDWRYRDLTGVARQHEAAAVRAHAAASETPTEALVRQRDDLLWEQLALTRRRDGLLEERSRPGGRGATMRYAALTEAIDACKRKRAEIETALRMSESRGG